MPPPLEVIIPARNPSEVFLDSIHCLASQGGGDFVVTISDNHSTKGLDYLEQSEAILKNAGIAWRRVRPGRELGRVEHWNWAIYQAQHPWVKPLFLGDTLLPGAMQKYHAATQEEGDLPFMFSPYIFCAEEKETLPQVIPWAGRNSAEKMREVVLKYGMQFGPPSGVLFRRDLFISCGGFAPGLPITADCLLFCRMAMKQGAFCFPEPMFRFTIHANRFSIDLAQKRLETFWETVNYRTTLLYYAWTQGWPLHLPHYGKAMLKLVLGR